MRLKKDFFTRDASVIAPELIGKLLVRKFEDNTIAKYRITEIEIYSGEDDTACHASRGKTPRNAPMYEEGGCTYIYLCYGVHYLINVVTGKKDYPEALLLRGLENLNGPGILTKALKIDKTLNKEDLTKSKRIWIEDDNYKAKYKTDKRVGIDYAKEPHKSIKWRYILINE